MPRRMPPHWIALSPGTLEGGSGAVSRAGGRSASACGPSTPAVEALVRAVRAAVAGGMRAILLREPHLEDRPFLELACAVRAVLDAPGVGGWLGLHDRLHLVPAAGADGAHVGGGSLPVAAARGVLGDDVVLGVSTHSSDLEGEWAGADIALHAPVFPPISKPGNRGGGLGVDGLRDFVARCSLPVWGLGGLTAEGLSELVGTGAAGACTIGALWGTDATPIHSQRGALGDLAGIEERARSLSRAAATAFGEVSRA